MNADGASLSCCPIHHAARVRRSRRPPASPPARQAEQIAAPQPPPPAGTTASCPSLDPPVQRRFSMPPPAPPGNVASRLGSESPLQRRPRAALLCPHAHSAPRSTRTPVAVRPPLFIFPHPRRSCYTGSKM